MEFILKFNSNLIISKGQGFQHSFDFVPFASPLTQLGLKNRPNLSSVSSDSSMALILKPDFFRVILFRVRLKILTFFLQEFSQVAEPHSLILSWSPEHFFVITRTLSLVRIGVVQIKNEFFYPFRKFGCTQQAPQKFWVL